MLNYDIDRICRAAELCIDPTWGDQRMDRVREAVSSEDINRNVFFTRKNEPLNELVRLGRQSMPALASIFQMVLDKRSRLTPASPREEEIKVRKRETTAKHRLLASLAVKIEEAKQGRRLGAAERAALIERKKKEWVVKRMTFANSNPNYKSRADAYDAANSEIEGNLRAELMQAKATSRY